MASVKVKVPNLSGFDKSFQNLLTSKVGTITPILIDEIIPNTKINLRTAISASLPPLASDTFMRCNLKVEAFFVPMRLLYGGFEDWLTSQKHHYSGEDDYRVGMPYVYQTVHFTESLQDYEFFAPGSLADYLGCRSSAVPLGQDSSLRFNILPFLAYHRVYDDWYRNPLIQKPLFYRHFATDTDASMMISNLPFVSYHDEESISFDLEDSVFDDGVSLGALRQRNFGSDYFTTALPDAQLGDAKRVTIETPSGGSAGFTIAALRMANSLQQFAERNQLAGPRLQDYVRANYGADLSSGVAQRAIVLGSGEIPVYSKGVYANSNSETSGNSNPFGSSVGAEYGSASCVGDLNLVDGFVAAEPGYLLVNATLVPKVTYASGIHPMLTRYTEGSASNVQMATPLLENTGFESVSQMEVTGRPGNTAVFGYVQRFANFKTRYDELHGLLRDGQNLDAFALQRVVTGSPTISSEFLQIPTNYLDQVAAVSDSISNYGMWLDCYHSYKVAMPLSEFAIPTLQDPAYEHGHDVTLKVGGSSV